jgi:hypothetical protein
MVINCLWPAILFKNKEENVRAGHELPHAWGKNKRKKKNWCGPGLLDLGLHW